MRRSNHEGHVGVELLRDHPRLFAPVVTHNRPLDKINEAFALNEKYEDGVGKARSFGPDALRRGVRSSTRGSSMSAMKFWRKHGRRSAVRGASFLQSLIHLAVGLYHWQRGNPTGAASQLQKGLDKLGGYVPACEGIDTARLYRDAVLSLAQIESGVGDVVYPRIHLS